MSLDLRNIKSSALTWNEMDGNLLYLNNRIDGLTASGTGLSFSAVLTLGNETGGNNIVISNGDVINAENGGGQLDLRYGADNKVMLSTDAGAYTNEFITMEPGYVAIQSTRTGGGRVEMYGDEYLCGFGIGDFGIANDDFYAYGKNGFSLGNRVVLGQEWFTIKHNDRINIDALRVVLPTIPTYADNAAAISGGLTTNMVYKTATGELRIVV
jgi:hypothetical protein